MDATLNPQNENTAASFAAGEEKSEIMQLFEHLVSDKYWAYRDLLKAIFESENQA